MKNYFKLPIILSSIFWAATTPSVFAQRMPFQFEAKGIITLTDADMAASALSDGNLKNDATEKDLFTAIKWSNYYKDCNVNTLNIQNSVNRFSKGLIILPDNKTAFFVPTRGNAPNDVKQVKNAVTDLPAINKIYAVDISDILNPKITDSMDIGRIPLSIDLRRSGDLLAIVTDQRDNEIWLVDWKNGKFGAVNKNSSGFAGKAQAMDCAWDSTGKFLAITLDETKQVALYYVRSFPKGVAFKQYGEPVTLGKRPGTGYWTNDNKYYIVASKKWDGTENSEISVIAFDREEGKTHKLVSKANVGANADGLAISPDSKYIVTTNIRESHRSSDDPKLTVNSSLSLLTLNTEGVLSTVGEYELQGIMPKSVDFDAKGNMIAVAVYDYWDTGAKSHGGIEFWKLEKGDKPSLKNTGFKMSVPRGIHSIRVLK